jgi:hypothetical protein
LANARNEGTSLASTNYEMHAGPDNVIPLETFDEMIEKLD